MIALRSLLVGGMGCLLLLAACGPAPAPPAANRPLAQPTVDRHIVYASLGASETIGVGADDPVRQSWPMAFYQTALPRSATFYNFGISGETTEGALTDEVPAALAQNPNLVTVWLNVDDLIAGVSTVNYEARLGKLLHEVRRGGARVLVANTPYLDRLALLLACRDGSRVCSVGGQQPLSVPFTAAQVNAQVDDYNIAIARVAAREGATVVDLHAAGEIPDLHPSWVSSDGFHPSTEGYAAVARMFAATWRSA